jgi:hypothetical protein
MARIFPPDGNLIRTIAKNAALSLLLANAGIFTLDARPMPPPPGLVSWWPGDRNAKDVVDNNYGLLKGGASFGNGLVKEAFKLDGANDFVLVPDSANLRLGTSDFTIDLWVNFRNTNGEQSIATRSPEQTRRR